MTWTDAPPVNPRASLEARPLARSAPAWWVLATIAAALTGCATPPSVSPLMRVVDRVLGEEILHLEADAARDAEHLRQTREALADAFDADLAGQQSLTAEWVRSAVRAYASAGESLARHEADRARQRSSRADNLRAAIEAQRRALAILEQRDRLIEQTLGGKLTADLWRQP